jgi:general secretion pathway protein A
MYPSHWGLTASPFRNCLDPRYFYQSPTHEEALARLSFLVEQHRRLGLLMGPEGSGKSLLLEVFADTLRRGGLPTAKVNLLGIEPAEMLAQVAIDFGLNPDRGDSTAALWRLVADRLLQYRYQQLEATILLDDADQAARPVLAQVARLAQHDPSPESRLTLVLVGQQQQMGRIGPRLLGLAELRIDIQPWEQADTENYLNAALAQAGCREAVFSPPALARLQELSQGIPRRVNQLADLALLAGAGAELQQLGAEVIDSAYHELSVATAAVPSYAASTALT